MKIEILKSVRGKEQQQNKPAIYSNSDCLSTAKSRKEIPVIFILFLFLINQFLKKRDDENCFRKTLNITEFKATKANEQLSNETYLIILATLALKMGTKRGPSF